MPRQTPPPVKHPDRPCNLAIPPGLAGDRQGATAVPVPNDPVERQSKERPRQRREHADHVLRVRQTPEEQQKRAQLVLEPDARSRHFDGQVAILKRPRVDGQVLAGAGQNHEVAGLPFAGSDPARDLRGDARRVVPRDLVLTLAFDRVRGQQPLPPCPRPQRGERGLVVRVLPREAGAPVEDPLHQLAEVVQRTEVGFEVQHLAELRKAPLHELVQRYVGTPEPIDALLGIAHDEEGAGPGRDTPPVVAVGVRIARQQQQDLGLERIGVLELVDQHASVALPKFAASTRVLAQQLGRQHKQVLECDVATGLSLARVALAGRPGHAQRHGIPVSPPVPEQPVRPTAVPSESPGVLAEPLCRELAGRGVGPALLNRLRLDSVELGHRVEQHRGVVPVE